MWHWQFHDISLTVHGTPAHVNLLCVLSMVGVGMQQYMIRNQNDMHKLSKAKNGRKYATNKETVLGHFSLTFPWLLVKFLTFHSQLSNSPTFTGFPDKWSPCSGGIMSSGYPFIVCYQIMWAIIWTRDFENKWTNFDANWHKWSRSMKQSTLGASRSKVKVIQDQNRP